MEIRYEGVVIDRISAMAGSMEQGGVLQLTTAEPMPVGTRLELCVGPEVSFVRVVRVTEASVAATSVMHVRAVGQSEPFEVTLLPNPDYSGEYRAVREGPRPEPVEPPIVLEADGAVPEPVGNDPSLNGTGEHDTGDLNGESNGDNGDLGPDEVSGLHDPNAASNGANNKRRRRRRR